MSKLLRCGPNYQTLVDDDFQLGDGNFLYIGGVKYVYIQIGKNKIPLHRHIMGLTKGDGLEVDHINLDKLDNRKCNLRIVTRRQNLINRPKKCCRKNGSRWQAYANENKKWINLGYHDTEELAIQAANEWKAKNRGEYACLWPLAKEQQRQLV